MSIETKIRTAMESMTASEPDPVSFETFRGRARRGTVRRAVLAGAAAAAVAVTALFLLPGGAPQTGTVTPPKPSTPRVIVANSAFTPQNIVIEAGESIVWEWNDGAPHEVWFDDIPVRSHPNCFDATDECARQSDPPFVWTFDTPGTYRYRCRIHAAPQGPGGMTGTVTVLARD